MPNWCEGRMKVRGKFTDVVSCLQNSFEGLKYGENLSMVETPENIKIDTDYVESGEFEISFHKIVYVKGSHLAFVERGLLCKCKRQGKPNDSRYSVQTGMGGYCRKLC